MRIPVIGVLSSILLCACHPPSDEPATLVGNVLGACPELSETGRPPIVQRAQRDPLSLEANPPAPTTRSIKLTILRPPATTPPPQPDPRSITAGGPGQSAVGIAAPIWTPFS